MLSFHYFITLPKGKSKINDKFEVTQTFNKLHALLKQLLHEIVQSTSRVFVQSIFRLKPTTPKKIAKELNLLSNIIKTIPVLRVLAEILIETSMDHRGVLDDGGRGGGAKSIKSIYNFHEVKIA